MKTLDWLRWCNNNFECLSFKRRKIFYHNGNNEERFSWDEKYRKRQRLSTVIYTLKKRDCYCTNRKLIFWRLPCRLTARVDNVLSFWEIFYVEHFPPEVFIVLVNRLMLISDQETPQLCNRMHNKQNH